MPSIEEGSSPRERGKLTQFAYKTNLSRLIPA